NGFGRLDADELFDFPGNFLNVVNTQSQCHALHRAEGVDQQGNIFIDNVFEQQSRAVAFHDPVGDLGDLEFSFDGIGDTLEFALLRQNLNEFCQAVIGHISNELVVPSTLDSNQNVYYKSAK